MKKINSDKKSIRFATEFFRDLKQGLLIVDNLPNTAPNYTNRQEKVDTSYYVNEFLESSLYDSFRGCEVEEYYGW